MNVTFFFRAHRPQMNVSVCVEVCELNCVNCDMWVSAV